MSDDLVRRHIYGSPQDKEAVLAEMDGDVDDPVALVRSCLLRKWDNRSKGLTAEDHFELPHLHERYPEELLSFLVPAAYDPAESTGLLILLHGGGSGTPRERR